MLTEWLPRVVDQTVHDSSSMEGLSTTSHQAVHLFSTLEIILKDDAKDIHALHSSNSRQTWWWILQLCPRSPYDHLLRLRHIQCEIVLLCPHLDVLELFSHKMRVHCIKHESSAYLLSSSKSCSTRKSLALMTYAKGPIPEPWTMLALMSRNTDVFPFNFVQCCLSSKKSKSQLCAKSWIGNFALFSRSVECEPYQTP